jgi:outer membrane receptor protein involved in Fe transport
MANLTSLPLSAQQYLGPLADITLPGTTDPAIQNYPYAPGNDDPRRADWATDLDWQLRDAFWMAATRAQWKLSESVQATGLLSYGRLHSDHTLLPQGGVDQLESDQDITATLQTVQGEFRLAGTAGERFEWIAGVSANHDETKELHIAYATHNSFNFGPPIVGNPTGIPLLFEKAGQRAATQADSAGVFLTGTLALSDDWKFTQGIRYTREKRHSEGCTYEPVDSVGVIGLTRVVNGISLSRGGRGDAQKGECFTLDADGNPGLFADTLKEHNVSLRSVIDWTPAEDALLYASVTRGYKSGGFPVIIATDQANLAPATQERLMAYELGAKLTLPGRWAHVDVAAFHYDYKNKQLLTYKLDRLFGSLPLIRNAPKSEVNGGEISLVLVPVDALTITAVAAYIDTRVIEFVSTTAKGETLDFHGRPFNYAPKVQAALVATWEVLLGSDLRLTPGADVTYGSHTNATLEGDPTFAIGHYVMFGTRATLARGPWSVTAFGRNLSNELQKFGVFRTGDTVAVTTAYPRTYGVTLGYDF